MTSQITPRTPRTIRHAPRTTRRAPRTTRRAPRTTRRTPRTTRRTPRTTRRTPRTTQRADPNTLNSPVYYLEPESMRLHPDTSPILPQHCVEDLDARFNDVVFPKQWNAYGYKHMFFILDPALTDQGQDFEKSCPQFRSLPLQSTVREVLQTIQEMARAMKCISYPDKVFSGIRFVNDRRDEPVFSVWFKPISMVPLEIDI